MILDFGSNTVDEMINNLELIKTLDCNDISIQISNQLKFDYSKFKDFPDSHYYELGIDLYVATPEEFWRIVHEEAERISYHMH